MEAELFWDADGRWRTERGGGLLLRNEYLRWRLAGSNLPRQVTSDFDGGGGGVAGRSECDVVGHDWPRTRRQVGLAARGDLGIYGFRPRGASFTLASGCVRTNTT